MTIPVRLASGLLVTSLFHSHYVFAETLLNQPVEISHATVFLRGAELDNTVTLSLNKGRTRSSSPILQVILTHVRYRLILNRMMLLFVLLISKI